MKLSEAIRLGAMMKPQYRGNMTSSDDAATCALGAALDAVGMLLPGMRAIPLQLSERWPYLYQEVETKAPPMRMPLVYAIVHLNDKHGWTREEIADWVEQFETQPSARWMATESQPAAR